MPSRSTALIFCACQSACSSTSAFTRSSTCCRMGLCRTGMRMSGRVSVAGTMGTISDVDSTMILSICQVGGIVQQFNDKGIFALFKDIDAGEVLANAPDGIVRQAQRVAQRD